MLSTVMVDKMKFVGNINNMSDIKSYLAQIALYIKSIKVKHDC